MDLRNDNPCDRVLPVLGPQNDIVTHRLALPHKDVAAAIETVRVSASAQPAVKQAIELLDRDEREEIRFALADLPQHVEKFGFIIGVQRRTFRDQDPVNIEASELIARLHDALGATAANRLLGARYRLRRSVIG